MAIEWTVSITNVDVDDGRATTSFTRTDTEDSTEVWSTSYGGAIIETGPDRAALLNQVWDAWQDELANRSAIATFISDLETTAKANLEARES